MGAEHPHRTWCPKCRVTFCSDRCTCGVTEWDKTFQPHRYCDCYSCSPQTRPLYLADVAAGMYRSTGGEK